MYEYLRELHRLFNSQPDCTEQVTELETLKADLKKGLDDHNRKLFLRFVDVGDVMDYEISLESFAAGFRMAYGLICEVNTGKHYSYEEAETRRICQEGDSPGHRGDTP